MTENPLNIDHAQLSRILMQAGKEGADAETYHWREHTFAVSSNPNQSVALRLDLTGSSDCVLVELGPTDLRSPAHPEDLPFVDGFPVRFGLIGDSLMAMWWIGPDRDRLEQMGSELPELQDDETQEVIEKYTGIIAEGGDQAESARADLKKVMMERAKKLREDPDLMLRFKDRMTRMKEILGDGAEIKEVFKTVLGASESAGWIRGEVSGEDDADWRGATLERGNRTRTLFMQAPGPVGMVMLHDLPTSGVQPTGCEV